MSPAVGLCMQKLSCTTLCVSYELVDLLGWPDILLTLIPNFRGDFGFRVRTGRIPWCFRGVFGVFYCWTGFRLKQYERYFEFHWHMHSGRLSALSVEDGSQAMPETFEATNSVDTVICYKGEKC